MGSMGKGMGMIQLLNLIQQLLNHSLCDYSDAYILVTGNIAVVGGDQNTSIVFRNCSPFRRCVTRLNDEHIETTNDLDVIMNMYNLIEYSDNYAESSGTLWQYKRDEQIMIVAGNPDNVTENGSSSFKYKSGLLKDLTSRDVVANGNPDIAAAHKLFANAKIVVPVKYLSNVFRSLEMPLVNTKIHLELNWNKKSITTDAAGAKTFQITSTKLYVPIVNLPFKESVKLKKQL